MGLFSGIGKVLKKVGNAVTGAVGGAIKTVGTVVNPQNLIDVATGNASKVVGKILDSAKTNVLGGAVAGFTGTAKAAVQTAAVTTAPPAAVVVAGAAAGAKPMVVTKSTTAVTKSNTVGDLLKVAAGGAAVALGTQLAGTEPANNVINTTGWNALKTWFKNNWYWPVGALVAVGGFIMYRINSKNTIRGKYRTPKQRWF